ncbi:cytochrome c oxidase subunit 4 [Cryobacterium sp. TMT1-21]|uniref:Cytochrome c oxidase polypeptide 4 n=1 Tax=Cryobacterium shii TaxID=1259235 RepID=A0AAQ2C8X1_9MICO|nr:MULTISPECIES: cytochrome c oxidase subunit 4 [Cryobacterium]TFC52613.1 cytochrome c oxidase subunit 4 [Cryobacterium shii]TFC82395.1 cytochrome c oxidase subunit 4 [Cryobacterium sp. TmT2-59]TFD16397.1 cytochrome c oxidase subunit 4 [Cryobacterium sp. TMT1-21]TFD17710.1 cytochrome c oxidase subunit 4 [Cryobacterium sp. TMT4-10]TFD27987.1 cytochrome c oxidase subunit 4 [Cryobacterium sp. TMT2-23]
MRANVNLLWILTGFFVVVATAYTVWGLIDPSQGRVEWAGTFVLSLCAVFVAFVAFYLSRVHGAQGGELPEDRLDANIDDGDPEVGFYSPWSWWPILLAGSAALLFMGLAVGVWISIIALGIGIICLVGWVYEYYRGNFAR